jgi:hypothetical protein
LLEQQTGAQSNLVALPTGNIENWGESAMAGSPMTDTSTDPDTDERNQMVVTILSSLLSWSVLLDEYDMLDFCRIFVLMFCCFGGFCCA